MRDRQKVVDEMIQSLVRQGKSLDAMKLLIESGDLENAAVIAQKSRADMEAIARRLWEASGRTAGPESASSPVQNEAPAPTAGVERPADSVWDDFERKLESLNWDSIVRFFRSPLKAGVVAIIVVAIAIPPLRRAWLSRSHGLSAEYFSDRDLQDLVLTRRHIDVDFRWLRRSPKGMPRPDDFSIRFTGSIVAPAQGDYEFFTLSDDGVRLWINDQLLIDNWGIHGATLNNARITLSPGRHKLRLEYFQGSGDSVLKLMWKRPGVKDRDLVAPRFLLPDDQPAE